MSSAFVREREGGEAFEDLPDRPVSDHPNFVTREGLAQIEGEVARFERELRYWASRKGSAQLVETVEGDSVHFGSTVTLVREGEGEQVFRIVGEDEADPAKGSISYVAPLARAITGKGVGDTVEVNGHEVEIAAVAS